MKRVMHYYAEQWRDLPPRFVAACVFIVGMMIVNAALLLLRWGGMLPKFSLPMAVLLTGVSAYPCLLVAGHVYRTRSADAEVRGLRDAIERHERDGRQR